MLSRLLFSFGELCLALLRTFSGELGSTVVALASAAILHFKTSMVTFIDSPNYHLTQLLMSEVKIGIIRWRRGCILEALGYRKEAFEDFAAVIESIPCFERDREFRCVDQFILRDIRRAVERANDWQLGLQLFSRWIERFPNSLLGHHHRGVIQRRLGDHDRAVLDFTIAIALAETDSSQRYSSCSCRDLRARCSYERRQYYEACADLTFCCSNRAFLTLDLLRRRGIAVAMLHQFSVAIHDLTYAIRLCESVNASQHEERATRGWCYQLTGDLVRAKQDYTGVLRTVPNHFRVLYNLASLFQSELEMTEASDTLDEAFRNVDEGLRDEEFNKWVIQRAELKWNQGDEEGTLEDLERMMIE